MNKVNNVKCGNKVKVINKLNGYKSDQDTVNKLLTLNAIYTVDVIYTHSRGTYVYLYEIPGIGFNSVHFKIIESKTLTERLEKFAEVNNIEFVSDEDMIAKMEQNEQNFGVALCPCSFMPEGTELRTKLENVCPCLIGMEILETSGACSCGLFKKKG